MPDKKETIKTLVWCLFWGLVSTVWCWTSMFATGATYDELFSLKAGLESWHNWNHRELLARGTMPLPAEVQTLPLLLAERFFGADLRANEWNSGTDPIGNFWTWLPIARLGTTLFWWLLLWAVFRTAALYGGPDAGRWAFALVACEPVLLGHASLATTDVAFAACLLSLIGAFRSRRDEPGWRRRLLCPSAWFMLAFLAKATALVFVPVCLTLVELERLVSLGWRPGKDWRSWQKPLASIRDLLVMALIGIALLFIVCPGAWEGINYQIHHNLSGHGSSRGANFILALPELGASTVGLVGAPHGQGSMLAISSLAGERAFVLFDILLLGQIVPGGFWYYFPAVLVIKLGLPILILLLVLMRARPRFLLNGPMWAALGLLALTPTFRVQLGIRMVLSLVVLSMVGAAVGFARWRSQGGPGRQRAVTNAFGMVLVLCSFTSACQIWPHGICFTNWLWGGTDQGYRALWDSNYDWGQGLKDLVAWQKLHPDRPMKICYFGKDPTLTRLSMPAFTMEEAVNIKQSCYLAVSTHYMVSTLYRGKPNFLQEFLAHQRLCGRTRTYFIYELTDTPASGGGR